MAKKPIKNQNLTIRMDEKTRFALDFLVRLEGQNASKLVERIMLEKADASYFGHYNKHMERKEYNWRDIWHVSEGVRHLLFITHPGVKAEIHLTFEEEEMAEFVQRHWPFFCSSDRLYSFIAPYVDILWPHMDALVAEWREHKATDPWRAGESMKAILESVDVAPPVWPPKSNGDDE
ncbi:hypothetical protein [Thalassospira povalilytica]|uniref:hypothetical protein n=1 Tax=Thalassospira povalilytica TaxID=732237 RepID=UPI001D181C26|nr:hypothetical protein [Thalassospira povalilytica]MCC4240372.1 hypothetical protein [Thalassospira povalilytica]